MAINWAQGKGAVNVAGGVNTIAVTFTNPVGAGNTVCGCVSMGSTQTVSNVKDDQLNTYNLETQIVDTGNGQTAQAFSLSNITNGPATITVTFSANASAMSLVADEFSGCATAATDERDSTAHGGLWQHPAPGTGTNAVTSGNFTTTVAGDLLYGVSSDTAGSNSGTFAAGTTSNAIYALTSTTSGTTAGSAEIISEWAIQSAPSATTAATFTQSVNDIRVTFLIAIKAAVVAGARGWPTLITVGGPFGQ